MLLYYSIYWTRWENEIKCSANLAFYLFSSFRLINSIKHEHPCKFIFVWVVIYKTKSRITVIMGHNLNGEYFMNRREQNQRPLDCDASLLIPLQIRLSQSGLEIIKHFVMFNSTENEFILLINIKTPTFVGIFIFISMINISTVWK